jgi:tetratricopeptide (TPR) repeat protein
MAAQPQLIDQARSLLSRQRYDQAADACIQGLADTPNDPELLTLLALCDEARGDLPAALKSLQTAVGSGQSHLGSCFHLGRLLAARGEAQQAREMFDYVLGLNPNHAPARTLLARLDYLAGNRTAALTGLKTALKADPRHIPALTTLADLLLEEGELEQAHEQASRALRIKPESVAVQMSGARVFQARGLDSFARQCLENAIQSAPRDPMPHLALARLLQKEGRHQQAVQSLEAAAGLGYSGPDLSLAQARSLRRTGRLEEAGQLYEALLKHPQATPELILEVAEFCIEAGDSAYARELLDHPDVLGRNGRDLLQARLFVQEGDPAAAMSLAASLHLSEEPSTAIGARMLSTRLALAANDPVAARDALEPLLQDGRATPAMVWLSAQISQTGGAPDEAIVMLSELLEREGLSDDDRARTHAMLIEVHDRAERFAEASRHFPGAAWRAPFLGYQAPVADEQPQEGSEQWTSIQPWRWETEGPDDGRKQPLFLGGWPGSGRELLLAALSASASVRSLTPSNWPQRRQELGLPANAEMVGKLDQADARLTRRRILRRLADGVSTTALPIEHGPLVAADMPMLARIFPGTTVVMPRADEADLKMHWRLNGYRDIEQMLKAWQREVALAGHLRAFLPLNFVDVDLAELFASPLGMLRQVCEQLDVELMPAMVQAMDEARVEFGYRAPGHWKNYVDRD